jgi:hypothetical protein
MGEILPRPGQGETFLPVRVVRVQLCCSLYEIVHAPRLSVWVTSVVEQNPMAKGNAGFCYCPLFWLVQLDMLWCSLILVLLEQMTSPTYVFPHLQGRQYISDDCRSRSLDGTKHIGDFPGKILLWSHLWLRWVGLVPVALAGCTEYISVSRLLAADDNGPVC